MLLSYAAPLPRTSQIEFNLHSREDALPCWGFPIHIWKIQVTFPIIDSCHGELWTDKVTNERPTRFWWSSRILSERPYVKCECRRRPPTRIRRRQEVMVKCASDFRAQCVNSMVVTISRMCICWMFKGYWPPMVDGLTSLFHDFICRRKSLSSPSLDPFLDCKHVQHSCYLYLYVYH